MTYSLGVDLGTTYTAAAMRRDDRLEIIDLGTRSAAIPSVVYLRDDGTVLTGEAAARRGATDPSRLSREFKRRMGDTTAILLGGVPYSVDALMASMLRSVVATATERQGEPPIAIAIAHPANWGQYKKDLLDQAVRRADLDHVELVTEPQAAAVHYATLERLDPGAVVAVYDLGGGTFDAAVLRKTGDGFELLGEPEGIERLGGIDFDEAVFRHVTGALGGAIDSLDPDDPVAQAAVSRLRDECVAAKEALSGDTEVSVPVLLPTVQTEVRLTRAEFEAMIRPALGDTLVVLRRALRSAGVDATDLHSVLLVGGSSRIPLISQMVGAELGRPVALDIHPKHSVALGAAALAGRGPVAAAPAPSTATAAPVPDTGLAPPPAPAVSVDAGGPAEPVPAPVTAPDTSELPPFAAAPPQAPTRPSAPAPAAAPSTPPAPYEPPPAPEPPGPKRRGLLVGGAAVVLAAVAVGAGALLTRGDDDAGATDTTTGEQTTPTDSAASTTAAPSTPATTGSPGTTDAAVAATTNPATTAPPATTVPPDPCAPAGDTEPCIVIDALRVTETGAVEVTWTPRNFVPDVANGFHAHLFWNTGTPAQASTDAAEPVDWDAVDQTIHTSDQVLTLANRPPAANAVCATVGIAPAHTAYNPELFHCLPLPEGATG